MLALLVISGAWGCTTSFTHTVRTQADPDRLWEAWTDVDRWPTWDTELESAALDGPFVAGAKGRLDPADGPESSFELVSVDPKNGYTYVVSLPLSGLRVERTAAVDDEGLSFTHKVSFEGALGWFFAGILGGGYEEALPEVMEGLARQAETSSVTPKVGRSSAAVGAEP